MLKFTSAKPSNTDLGKYIGKSEGSIRNLKRDNEKEYEKKVLEYKMSNNPFIKLGEFKQYLKDSGDYDKEEFSDLKKLIEENNIPHTVYVDGNEKKHIYLPTVLESFIQLNEMFRGLENKEPAIISIGNHKGGAAKTTNTTNLASTLAYLGYKVLIVDFDHQGNSSGSFGLYAGDYENTIIDLIGKSNEANIKELVQEAIININVEDKFRNNIQGRLDVIPNNATMSELVEDLPSMSRTLGTIENTLDNILSMVKDDYDFILIDLPPRTDIILRTAMMASDYFIVSLSPQPFAKMGMPYILNPIEKFKNVYSKEKGKEFKILGGVIGHYEKGSSVQDANYAQIKDDILSFTKDETSAFETHIPKSTAIQVSQQGDGSLLFSDPSDKTTKNYLDLTIEVLERVISDRYESRGF